ncbi:MAG: pyridoxal phosphate-dependent aminotransferase [Acidobacteriota bacterium]|nr:pyridoxal phosphate-dependent aminotransferase [Acidobacteriota bacterium]
MRFSERTAWELGENPFAANLRRARASGRELLDLTVSNPTACGFAYDEAALLAPLAHPHALRYEPEPLGMASARAAVADYYRDAGADIPIQHLCLTTSTSEAYSFLFRLLCDPGDEVLIASPSYPLFDYIARLDSVRLVEYPLLYHDGWQVDLDALAASVTARTRAIIVVHPNNPTGHFCSPAERAALQTLCAERGLALIVDEVFLDYPLPGVTANSFTAAYAPALTFVLSGLSKVCALPQMKCSWIATLGPAPDIERAMARLEIIADTFLSMNSPVQHALPKWLAGRRRLQHQIRARLSENLAALDRALIGSSCQRFKMDAGWTTLLRVPRTVAGIEFCAAALARGVVVQSGEFYGLPVGRAVLSLLVPPELWRSGLERLPCAGS